MDILKKLILEENGDDYLNNLFKFIREDNEDDLDYSKTYNELIFKYEEPEYEKAIIEGKNIEIKDKNEFLETINYTHILFSRHLFQKLDIDWSNRNNGQIVNECKDVFNILYNLNREDEKYFLMRVLKTILFMKSAITNGTDSANDMRESSCALEFIIITYLYLEHSLYLSNYLNDKEHYFNQYNYVFLGLIKYSRNYGELRENICEKLKLMSFFQKYKTDSDSDKE